MTDPILPGLVRRRAELAGAAQRLRAELTKTDADLVHVDAVIQQIAPELNPSTIPPKRPRLPEHAGRGEVTRFVLGALRIATGPVPTPVLVRHWMAHRGMDALSPAVRQRARKQVRKALELQKARSVVRSTPGPGQFVVWAVAG